MRDHCCKPRKIQRKLSKRYTSRFRSLFVSLPLLTGCSNLAPGGWFECHDPHTSVYSLDGTADETHPLNAVFELINGPFSKVFRWNLNVVDGLPEYLRSLGFVNVSEKKHQGPVGRWHEEPQMREFGMFHQTILAEFTTTIMARHGAMDMDAEEAEALTQRVLKAFDDPKIHAYMDWGSVWAQKPLN